MTTQIASPSPLSLRSMRDGPPSSLNEAIRRARRIVSDRTGIVAGIEFLEQNAEDPAVHQAWSTPANSLPLLGRRALNRGVATAADPDRAIMKAAGESIERYCSAFYDDDALHLASYEQLIAAGENAVDPSTFALFSASQYAAPGFRFTPFTATTPVRWVLGHALVTDRPTWVPAPVVYVPYYYEEPSEAPLQDSISTGQACGPTFAAATSKAILEAIERDAFMIVWQNRLARPAIDLTSVDDPQVLALLHALDGVPASCHAALLSVDIDVPVVLVVLNGLSAEHPPQTVIGVGVDLSPTRALVLALEEACLGFCGMSRLAAMQPDFSVASGFHDVDDLDKHGLAHAILPELRASTEFLTTPERTVTLTDLPDRSSPSAVANLRTLVDELGGKDFEIVAVDLTTPDIDEVGFKVVRAVVPGLQPLDISHARQHLGGRRLYDVPWRLGLRTEPSHEGALNPFPHPFP